MILKNGVRAMIRSLINMSSMASDPDGSKYINLNGTAVDMASASNSGCYIWKNDTSNNLPISFKLGTGNAAPTIEDYNLANPNSDFSSYSVTVTVDTTAQKPTAIYTMSAQYTGATDIDITEFGITKACKNSLTNAFTYMFYREVLPSAIHLSNGDSITLVRKWEIS